MKGYIGVFGLLLVALIIGSGAASAEIRTDMPALEISDLYYPPDFTGIGLQIKDRCEYSYGGQGIFFYQTFEAPLTVTAYENSDCTGTILWESGELLIADSYTVFIYPDMVQNRAFALHHNDTSPVPKGFVRLHVRNGYGSTPIEIVFNRNNKAMDSVTLANGDYQAVDVRPGQWTIALNGADRPYDLLTWNSPYPAYTHWLVELGGPVNTANADDVIGVWDFPYDYTRNLKPHPDRP